MITPKIDISIIIPAYLEARRIAKTLREVLAFMKRMRVPFEVIVVDDGSRDDTVSVVRKIARREPRLRLLRNPVNSGKGSAVRKGMLAARGRSLLFSDADLSTPIRELLPLSRALRQGADVVIASRVLRGKGAVIRQPWYRRAMRSVFNKFVRLLAVRGIHDTQCGFKLFTRSAARQVFPRQTLTRFGFDVELLYIARRLGLTIREVPVSWFYDAQTRMHYFRDSVNMVLDLVRIRLNDLTGKYRIKGG